jgi:hypothetical protein
MTVAALLAPLFVQVALTFVLMFWMAQARTSALRRGETHIRDTALGQPNWPTRVQQISNCYHNQFQLPVLFYVLTILAYDLKKADYAFVIMAWVFVISRIVHAYIHVTSNRVPRRFLAFAVGALVLLMMWAIFALRILLGIG